MQNPRGWPLSQFAGGDSYLPELKYQALQIIEETLWARCANRGRNRCEPQTADSGLTYSPINTIGEVGLSEPSSFSSVMANALASTPSGILWSIIIALPCSSGLKTPAAIGAPCMGMTHSS